MEVRDERNTALCICVWMRFGACDRMWSTQVHLVLVLASDGAFVVVGLVGNMIVVRRLFELGTASLLLAALKKIFLTTIVAQNSWKTCEIGHSGFCV